MFFPQLHGGLPATRSENLNTWVHLYNSAIHLSI